MISNYQFSVLWNDELFLSPQYFGEGIIGASMNNQRIKRRLEFTLRGGSSEAVIRGKIVWKLLLYLRYSRAF
jgi:hypothetical protein